VLHGYWHARSLDYIGSGRAHLWLRLPGDLVFIIFGAIPFVIASIKSYFGVRAHELEERHLDAQARSIGTIRHS
jgi:nitric oxide reductase subunit B